jgi:hypothetical protein
MDLILHISLFNDKEIQVINYCRMYLQVVMMSDICLTEGITLDPDLLADNLSDTSSKSRWIHITQARPDEPSWRLWCQAPILVNTISYTFLLVNGSNQVTNFVENCLTILTIKWLTCMSNNSSVTFAHRTTKPWHQVAHPKLPPQPFNSRSLGSFFKYLPLPRPRPNHAPRYQVMASARCYPAKVLPLLGAPPPPLPGWFSSQSGPLLSSCVLRLSA